MIMDVKEYIDAMLEETFKLNIELNSSDKKIEERNLIIDELLNKLKFRNEDIDILKKKVRTLKRKLKDQLDTSSDSSD
jgi:hypothetical protein